MTQPLVYLLDDDAALLKILERRFQSFNCAIQCFHDPGALIKAFHTKRPNLLLIDVNLGDGLSGFDVIHGIRNDSKSDVPIIILSSESDPGRVAHALELGANDFIVKPPLRADFEEYIGRYLKTDRLQEPLASVFQPTLEQKGHARLGFQVSIEEIRQGGITLLSDHLVKKGASFSLTGPELKAITPSSDKVIVTVIGSATKTIGEQKKYQLLLEVEASQEVALKEIRAFLDSKYKEVISE